MSSEAMLEPDVESDETTSRSYSSNPYVVGPAKWRVLPRLETKPEDGHRSGGYERFRSTEDLETQPGGKRDVYLYHHRLLALLHDDVVDEPIEYATAYVSRREVHHKNGIKWDNRIDNFELATKSEHSQITQSDMRAYAEDAKRALDEPYNPELGECETCGTETEQLATSPGFDGERCLECAMQEANGEPISL